MMFVQKVEIFTLVWNPKNSESAASASPINGIVSTYKRFYAVIIYINHFKRAQS